MAERIEFAIVEHCLRKGLGFIPDPKGDWFSTAALAHIFGCEPGTVQNKIYKLRKRGATIDEHPFGKYYRLSDFTELGTD